MVTVVFLLGLSILLASVALLAWGRASPSLRHHRAQHLDNAATPAPASIVLPRIGLRLRCRGAASARRLTALLFRDEDRVPMVMLSMLSIPT